MKYINDRNTKLRATNLWARLREILSTAQFSGVVFDLRSGVDNDECLQKKRLEVATALEP